MSKKTAPSFPQSSFYTTAEQMGLSEKKISEICEKLWISEQKKGITAPTVEPKKANFTPPFAMLTDARNVNFSECLVSAQSRPRLALFGTDYGQEHSLVMC